MQNQMKDHSQREDSVLDENHQIKPNSLEIWAELAGLVNKEEEK